MIARTFELPGVAFAIGPPEPAPPTLAFDLIDIGITSAVTQVLIDRFVTMIDRARLLYRGDQPQDI